MQAKLLRLLQERTYQRVGDSRSVRTDARIVAATNVELEQAIGLDMGGTSTDVCRFAGELEPLLMNIHGETHHVGKVPKCCSSGAEQQTQLIRLRREMKEAVAAENYERASQLRDEMRAIEKAREPKPA